MSNVSEGEILAKPSLILGGLCVWPSRLAETGLAVGAKAFGMKRVLYFTMIWSRDKGNFRRTGERAEEHDQDGKG